MSEFRIGAMFRPASPPEELRRYAREVEAFGYQELWVVEDCFLGGGVAAAAVALGASDHLTIGIGILPAVLRNPALAAMELATLARVYPGRLIGGVGHGVADWMRQVGAFPSSQLAALEEVTAVVRTLLAGKAMTVDGQHVHLDNVRLDHPPKVVPPIATGVRSVKSLRLSGRAADGTILTELSSPAYLRWAREHIDAGRAEAGRTDPHRITVYALLCMDEDADRARDAIRTQIAPFLRGGGNAVQLRVAGIEAEVAALVGGTADDMALGRAIPEEWLDLLAVAGNAEQCAAAVDRLRAAGADAVVLVPPERVDTGLDQLAAFARTVLPRAVA